ncbi:hypothetical protein QN277_011929 [Acacia crassicarpa]|uniref:Uncharacterized protein n=1 Tax=Acacia crassicarpa TaxID=499986 RepID=A0AAE1MZU3_9FABA|nr:hypothetical protein QN277_011929 [Acacia crassicarpa]
MNRFATFFPFLPLRWQPVFETGSAILAAFLALAGAAWYNHIPDLACFFLFLGGYWAFIYFLIFFHFKCIEMGNFSFDYKYVIMIVPKIISILWLATGDFVGFAACDSGIAGMEGPPTPPVITHPEAPLGAPELHPTPPRIPILDQPLLPEIQRQDELYGRFLINTLGEFPSLERIAETIRVQSLIEQHVEAALVDQGFPPLNILSNCHLIRGLIFYHRGRALSPRTYHGYLREISRLGTQDTRAFQRIIRAIQNSEIFL